MKKSTLFLAAAITAFILVIVASVIFKARAGVVAAAIAPTLAPSATPTDIPTDMPTETSQPTNTVALTPTQVIVTPQEAVFIASSALGNTQVYSVDTVTRYGLDVYQVNFSSGHIVFVSPAGHILEITMLQPALAPADPQASANNNNSPAPAKQKPSEGGGDGGGSGGGDD